MVRLEQITPNRPRPEGPPVEGPVVLPNGHQVRVLPFEQARRIITGSAVGAIIGADPYKDAADVYAAIVDGRKSTVTRFMKAGTYFEGGILQWYADETGQALTLWDQRYTAVSESLDFLGATPDAFAGTDVVVDAKNPGFHQREKYLDGTVPPGYYAQLQVQAYVTRYPFAQLAPVVGGNDLMTSDIFPLDQDYMAWVLERVAKFWRDHIQAGKPPKLRTREQAAAVFPKHKAGKVLEATTEIAELYLEWHNAKDREAKAGKEKDALADALTTFAVDAEAVVLPDGTKLFTYKANKDSTVFDPDAWAESEPEAFAAYQAAQERFTATKPGGRVLRDAAKGAVELAAST